MECYVCGKSLEMGFLCEEHARILLVMLEKGEGEVHDPTWKHHCLICGEYKDRRIVEYPDAGYFCDRDIREEWNRSMDKKK
jgi:predicted nucleic acid-binding Zn ribbon protein